MRKREENRYRLDRREHAVEQRSKLNADEEERLQRLAGSGDDDDKGSVESEARRGLLPHAPSLPPPRRSCRRSPHSSQEDLQALLGAVEDGGSGPAGEESAILPCACTSSEGTGALYPCSSSVAA